MPRIVFLIFMCPVTAVANCVFESPSEVLSVTTEQDAGWELLKDKDGICVWRKGDATSRISQVAAATIFDAPVAEIRDLINDCNQYPDVFHYVRTCEVVQEHDDGVWVFQQLDFPFFVSDRYYTIDMRSTEQESGGHQITWSLVDPSNAGRTGRGVATVLNNGGWYLRPSGQADRTRVLYYLHTDPGGKIPKGMVNRGNLRAVPGVLKDAMKALE